ncbi:MAG: hypothetical protein HOF76_02075 [Candidatus Scalindua sp.]|nr:hypothetical protein [Candidatus Scalindua sp.]MBT7592108.1 hypothetical protein [Candidatus Scalindua sp.]
MDDHKKSAKGGLNPLFESLEKAKIIDFHSGEQPKHISKEDLRINYDNKKFLFWGNSKLPFKGVDKNSLKEKGRRLISQIKEGIKNGTHPQKLESLYNDFMKNVDAKSKHCVGVLAQDEIWEENGEVGTLCLGEWHMSSTINFLKEKEISFIYLYNPDILVESRALFISLKEQCLRGNKKRPVINLFNVL